MTCYTAFYTCIYMYRYDTVLVHKAEGFHMADIGTELRILFPPQTCLAIQVLLFFFLPKFPSCIHFVSILTRITHVLYTYSSNAWIPQ